MELLLRLVLLVAERIVDLGVNVSSRSRVSRTGCAVAHFICASDASSSCIFRTMVDTGAMPSAYSIARIDTTSTGQLGFLLFSV